MYGISNNMKKSESITVVSPSHPPLSYMVSTRSPRGETGHQAPDRRPAERGRGTALLPGLHPGHVPPPAPVQSLAPWPTQTYVHPHGTTQPLKRKRTSHRISLPNLG